MSMVAIIKEYDIEVIKYAIALSEKNAQFKANGLFASDFIKLKNEEPELFDKVNALIMQGRWNPCVGMWDRKNEKLSEEALCRNILYSSKMFENEYHVFYGVDFYNASLAKCAYAGRYDAVIIENAGNDHWIECTDGSRVLVLSPKDFKEVISVDEEMINENDFITFEEYLKEILDLPLDLPVVKTGVEEKAYTVNEKYLLDYERYAAQQNKDVCEEVKLYWLCGGFENKQVQFTDNVKIDVPDIEVIAFKKAEDGSGDTVIRVRENAGRQTPVRLICDDIEAAFRFEILSFETITFRVDKEGYVTETFIQE